MSSCLFCPYPVCYVSADFSPRDFCLYIVLVCFPSSFCILVPCVFWELLWCPWLLFGLVVSFLVCFLMSILLGLWVVVFFLCPVPFFSFVVSMSQALFLFLFCLYLFPFDMKNPPGLSSQLSYMHVYFLFFDVVFCSYHAYFDVVFFSFYCYRNVFPFRFSSFASSVTSTYIALVWYELDLLCPIVIVCDRFCYSSLYFSFFSSLSAALLLWGP